MVRRIRRMPMRVLLLPTLTICQSQPYSSGATSLKIPHVRSEDAFVGCNAQSQYRPQQRLSHLDPIQLRRLTSTNPSLNCNLRQHRIDDVTKKKREIQI